MRHIPEDELHAYLDQALSRSQCIEIESHLAACAPCRDDRDLIAALRDRTTLLLAKVAPRTTQAPPFAQLIARADERRKTSWRRLTVLAAALAGAVVAGWGMRAMLDPHIPADPRVPASLAVDDPALSPNGSTLELTPGSVSIRQPDQEYDPGATVRLAATMAATTAPSTASRPATSLRLNLGDGWVTSTREEAGNAARNLVPEVSGLAVSEIRLRAGDGQERPVLVVTQTLPDGGTIFTVEGPIDAVAELVALQVSSGNISASEPTRSSPDYLPSGAGFQRSPRILAVMGPLSPDSLNTLALRVTLR